MLVLLKEHCNLLMPNNILLYSQINVLLSHHRSCLLKYIRTNTIAYSGKKEQRVRDLGMLRIK